LEQPKVTSFETTCEFDVISTQPVAMENKTSKYFNPLFCIFHVSQIKEKTLYQMTPSNKKGKKVMLNI